MIKFLRSTLIIVMTMVLALMLSASVTMAAPPERIVYTDGTGTIFQIAPNGAQKVQLVGTLQGASRSLPSPSGLTVLSYTSKLIETEPNGSGQVDLSSPGYSYAANFSWSPAGTEIAFSAKKWSAE